MEPDPLDEFGLADVRFVKAVVEQRAPASSLAKRAKAGIRAPPQKHSSRCGRQAPTVSWAMNLET